MACFVSGLDSQQLEHFAEVGVHPGREIEPVQQEFAQIELLCNLELLPPPCRVLCSGAARQYCARQRGLARVVAVYDVSQ